MEAPIQNGMKCIFQVLKLALHNCLPNHKKEEEKRFNSHSENDIFLKYSSCTDVEENQVEESLKENCGDNDNDDRDVMTFQKLPYECKLKIFSFLGAMERGMAERVCHDWKDVLRTPTLWTDIDLSLSKAFQGKTNQQNITESSTGVGSPGVIGEFKTKSKQEAQAEFEKYKSCVNGFVEYLRQIKPCVKSFGFSFDIGDSQDCWTHVLKNFLDSAHTKNTKHAIFNWKDTSAKPSALLDSSNTWSTGNYSDLMYKQRRRQRLFVSFFDSFTVLVPNLKSLRLPFDWSPSSVAHLARLGPTLVHLSLEEYFVPQPLEQNLLDKLLASLPNLEKLSVGLVLGSGLGVSGYEFGSTSLESLDLSKCQGFALMKVDLPNLKELRTSNTSFPSQLIVVSNETAIIQNFPIYQNRYKLNANQVRTSSLLKSSKSSPSLSTMQADSRKLPVPSGIPCLFNVLKKGAPSLDKLNDYKLPEDWREAFDPKLERILHQACSCLYHHQYHPQPQN